MIRTASPRRKKLGGIAALLAVPMLIVGLAACSPAAGGGDTPTPDSGSGQQQLTNTEWQLKYAECMRGEGIDMPDPSANGSVAMSLDDSNMAAVQAAAEVCQGKLGQMPAMNAEEQAAAEQEYLEWIRGVAECYRENGFDMPDPKTGEEVQWPTDAPDTVQEQCGGGAGTAGTTQVRG